MNDLKYIFAQPDYIDNVGEIYPITLKDYDKFQECSQLLYISRSHFEENQYPLFMLLFMSRQQLGLTFDEFVKKLEDLFYLTTQNQFKFFETKNNAWFQYKYKDNKGFPQYKIINMNNYDIVREIIMKQNLMFEQKVFKNKTVQEWANKVLENKQKNAPKITIEDIITTVSVVTGKHYKDLLDYSIYQVYSDFYRVRKVKNFDASILSSVASMGSVSIQDFAEQLDMFHNPYDDLFVSTDKLNKLNTITK
jgi:hypothetical protein